MSDVLMIALMVASIGAFTAYVACCDRIIGRADASDGRQEPAPTRKLEQAA